MNLFSLEFFSIFGNFGNFVVKLEIFFRTFFSNFFIFFSFYRAFLRKSLNLFRLMQQACCARLFGYVFWQKERAFWVSGYIPLCTLRASPMAEEMKWLVILRQGCSLNTEFIRAILAALFFASSVVTQCSNDIQSLKLLSFPVHFITSFHKIVNKFKLI